VPLLGQGRYAPQLSGSYPVPGAAAWHDEETDIAKAIGLTDVHVVKPARLSEAAECS
jgi:hypothetical protein